MSEKDLEKKARRIHSKLKESIPEARLELDFSSPLELLVATVLAAQSTDERVNKVTADLFERYQEPSDYLAVPEEQLQEDIRSTGFFRQKADRLRKIMRALIDERGGEVPADREALTALPGVGRKTANVVLANAFEKPAIAVDTHVKRVSGRLGLTSETNPDKIESDLCSLLPEEDWISFTLRLTLHGRYTCVAKKPKCDECPLPELCVYYQEEVAG